VRFVKIIDSISEWSGRIVMFLMVPMILVTIYDVVLRYLFRSPTAWAYEISWMTYAAFFILGGAYTLLENGHINVDIVYNKFPEKVRLYLRALFLLILLLPFVFFILRYSIPWALHSTMVLERAEHTLWRPYSFPVKWTLPIGFFLLALQGISEFLRTIISIFNIDNKRDENGP
jgi:TRAP-type mannitol/chloroaromatic compound transport system permease small subunit